MGQHIGIRKSKDKQDVLILNEYGSIISASLAIEAGKGYAADDDALDAWVVDGNNRVMDIKTGRYVQLITSWSVMPITIKDNSHSKITKDNINAIASAKESEELQYINRKEKEGGSKWLGMAAFAIIATDCIVGLWLLLSSGSLTLPFAGG